MSSCEKQRLVDAHFKGTIAIDEERTMRAHLVTCDACRARYRRHLLLGTLNPQALPAEARIAQGLGVRKTAPRSPLAWIAPALALAAAAVVLLLVRPRDDGFTARGGLDATAASTSASPLRVYRVAKGGTPAPVFDVVQRDDELAFAYENPEKKKYLMIYGISDRGRVYWFYPAWSNEAEDPRAVSASAEPGLHELPDAVTHHFEGTSLEVHSLLLDAPLTVRELEKRIASGPLLIPGASDHTQRLRMDP